jgi:hypothetical protein
MKVKTKEKSTKEHTGYSFPVGNQFWNLRTKHGRDKIFATPDLMWEAACEYFQWCIDNPLIEVDFRGKDMEKVFIPKMRPFNEIDVAHYLGVNHNYFNDFEKSIRGKNDSISRDFSVIITRIKETCFTQKFSGAATGFLNANLIARDLGLADKTQNENHNTGGILFIDVTPDYKPTEN